MCRDILAPSARRALDLNNREKAKAAGVITDKNDGGRRARKSKTRCELHMRTNYEAAMRSWFHLAPNLLAPGSIIEPGNFGRVIALVGAGHQLYRREMAYEAIRASDFNDRPSRLACLFAFPTRQEAEMCCAQISGYATSVLYEVESLEEKPHLADATYALQHYAQPVFDPRLIRCYWQGWKPSPDPKVVALREVLLRSPVKVVRKC
jgi:hypothetical protein